MESPFEGNIVKALLTCIRIYFLFESPHLSPSIKLQHYKALNKLTPTNASPT
jgi:hypothetical protein